MMKVDPKAIDLFCLIGLLPGGCTEQELDYMWGIGWLKLAERLLRASLLVKKSYENGMNSYTLLPFMNQYAENIMEPLKKKEYHLKCCNFYAKVLMDLFKRN